MFSLRKATPSQSQDLNRPTQQPAKDIYDALTREAAKRKSRPLEVWIAAERDAVWRAARDAALQLGSPVPTMDQVKNAECAALGHSDFGSKWARRVSEIITQSQPLNRKI